MASLTPEQIKAGWDTISDLFGRNNIAGLLDYVKNNPYYLNAKNPEWENSTTLQLFVIDEQEDNVEKYLKLKPDLKQLVYERGGTILMQVVEGQLEPNIAKMLIEADPETVNIANEVGQVPLMWAIQGENEYLVYDLVKNGAKKDVKDSSGNDVWAYFNGDADTRKALEDAMNGINPGGDETGTLVADDEEPLTAEELVAQKELFDEIDGESLLEVRSILTRYPRLLNREFDADDDGLMESPLRRAVNTQNINLIRFLVNLEADVTSQILQYQREIVDDARPGERAAPTAILRLMEGMEDEEEEEEEEPLTIEVKAARKKLHEAIEAGDNVTAKAVIAQYPKLINVRYNDESPLTNAVSSRNLEFVKHLIAKGVYVDEDDIEHAEYLAGHSGLTEEEKKLANDILAVIQTRVDQQTAALADEEEPLTMAELVARKKLHEAIETKDNVTAKAILAQYPILANIRYNDETPLTNAVSSRNLEFVKHLIDNGVYLDDDDLDHANYLASNIATRDLSEEEKQLARDILAAIQARLDVVEAARPVAPRLDIPPRALDFGDEPAMPTLEVTEIEYKELPDVFDMTLNKDIPIFDALAKRRIIFTVDDSYYGITLGSIESSLKDKTSTFYECKKELDGAPYTKDVHIDTPYFRLTLNGNFTVTEKDLQSALASECSIFELVPNEKKLAFVSSYRSVQVSPGRNALGQTVNIVSADHCQKGSDQFTYDVKAVTMVKYRSAEQKEVDRVEAEKKAVEDAAVAERMKQEAIVRKKAQEEQAARVAARGSGPRRTYRKGKKSNKRKTYRKESNGRRR